jgi:hypothetical protein
MEPMEPTQSTDAGVSSARGRAASVCWPAVAWGAGVGLVFLIAVATTRAVLDREVEDFADSGWTLPLFVLLVVGYLLAGWVAQRRAEDRGAGDAPLTHGALAGIGAFAAWVPLRMLIWVARDEDRGLVQGTDAALRPGQLFGAVVIAAGVGLLGGVLAARASRASRAKA